MYLQWKAEQYRYKSIVLWTFAKFSFQSKLSFINWNKTCLYHIFHSRTNQTVFFIFFPLAMKVRKKYFYFLNAFSLNYVKLKLVDCNKKVFPRKANIYGTFQLTWLKKQLQLKWKQSILSPLEGCISKAKAIHFIKICFKLLVWWKNSLN